MPREKLLRSKGEIQQDILRSLQDNDFPTFAQFVPIRDKESGKSKPFHLQSWNESQRRFEKNRTGKDVVLKPRQLGFSTMEHIRNIFFALRNAGSTTILIAHSDDLAKKQLQAMKQYYSDFVANCRAFGVHVFKDLNDKTSNQISNSHEIVFSNRSKILAYSAGNNPDTAKNPARGNVCDRLHATEVAMWQHPDITWGSIRPALTQDAEVVFESTPNGLGNLFYKLVQDAANKRNEYRLHFFPWYVDTKNALRVDPTERIEATSKEELEAVRMAWIQDEVQLSPEQIKWFRVTAQHYRSRGTKFESEYPTDPASCFVGSAGMFFDGEERAFVESCVVRDEDVVEIREVFWGGSVKIYEKPKADARYLIASDVAGGQGGDNSTFVVLNLESMELAATYACNRIIASDFGSLLVEYAQYFNGALLCVEQMVDGQVAIQRAIDLRYPNLYRGKYRTKIDGGFHTHEASRPLIFDAMKCAVREKAFSRMDRQLADELYILASDEKGRVQAKGKTHQSQKSADSPKDDLALAWGMALLVRRETPVFNSDWFKGAVSSVGRKDFGRRINGWN